MNIAERIRELRTFFGFSMCELARRSGVAQSSLSYYENGEHQPSVEILSRLCIALGITLSEFFREDKPEEEVPFDIKELTELAAKLTTEERAGLLIMLRAFVTRHTSTPGE